MALPYVTESQARKIAKDEIRESGPQPTPQPEHLNDFEGFKALIENIFDAQDKEESFKCDELFTFDYENTEAFEDKLLDTICEIDEEYIERLISSFPDVYLESNLNVIVFAESNFYAGPAGLFIGIEVDTEDPIPYAYYMPNTYLAKTLPGHSEDNVPCDARKVYGTIRIVCDI